MKIKELFDKSEDITLENYLIKCGVKSIEEYLNGCTLEDDEHYDNIHKIKEIVLNGMVICQEVC